MPSSQDLSAILRATPEALQAADALGSAFTAAIRLTPVDDGGDGEPAVVVTIRPIGNEADLGRLEGLVQLAGSVAHDFNNLLGVILNYTTLLTDEVTDPTALGDLEEIRKAAERAAELTHRLVTFARGESSGAEAMGLGDGTTGTAPERDGTSRVGLRRILLAEDEDALRSATDRILTAEGYEVLAARDGVEAIEIFEREGGAFDLLLSDVVMPRMRGDELARELVERRPSLPVVLVSGHDFGEAELPGRLLDKPWRTDDLLRTIREELGD